MKVLLFTVVTVGLLALGAGAVTAQSGNDLFQQALVKERTAGDMAAAIALYQTIVEKHSTDRALVARALVQMGGCYEKLGRGEAIATYERVVREFADQAESAATARTRLVSMRKAPAAGHDMAFRRVSDASANSVSHDGRYITFQLARESTIVRELATGKDYTLVTNQGSDTGEVISRDSKMVAYAWWSDGRNELHTIPLLTSSTSQPRRLFRSEDYRGVYPHDWSPDGTQIAVRLGPADGTAHIGLVSTADGSLKVLKVLKREQWTGTTGMSFSPDGKYLAYDSRADGNPEHRHVFMLAVDGSRETTAVAHPSDNKLAGWSPDRKHLLFVSDRTGSPGLWSQPVVDGRAQGAAALIKPDLGSSRSLGVTASGALYVSSTIESSDIEVVSVDFTAGQIVGSPVKPITDYVGANSQPEWSSDGTFMSYVSRREDRLVLAMRELGTGKERVVKPPLRRITSKGWSPDRKFFALQGSHLTDGYGLFLVDAETGDTSRVAANTGINEGGPAWSPDSKRLYYRASVDQDDRGIPVPQGRAIIELDLTSGKAREILRRPRLGVPTISPDGRWIATMTADAAGRSSTTILFPVSGGEVRELIRVDQPVASGIMFWAPDSNSVIVASVPSGKTREYWQAPISGGEPRRLDLKADITSRPHLHPDGRRLAYTTATETKDEVWVLENFLPKPRASK